MSPGSPMWEAHLGHSLLLSWEQWQGAGLEVELAGFDLVFPGDAGIIGGS